MTFEFAGDIIDVLKKQLGLDDKSFSVVKIWDRELGALAPDAVITGIRKGVLTVEVTSSAHFQELTLRKRGLIHKLNQYFGGERVVRDIKLKIKND